MREDNPREHPTEQLQKIAASMRRFGWTNPVLVDENDVVIYGHGRLMAASQILGLKEAPTLVAHGWSEEEKRAYVIGDNKLAETGWDDQRLGAHFRALDDKDLRELTGFSEAEIDDLLNPAGPIMGELNQEKGPAPWREGPLRLHRTDQKILISIERKDTWVVITRLKKDFPGPVVIQPAAFDEALGLE